MNNNAIESVDFSKFVNTYKSPMQKILNSLIQLSEAANSALPLLQTHDYRTEVKYLDEQNLKLEMFPRTLKDIINGILKYCVPIIGEEDNLASDALLNSTNMKIFTNNLNTSSDSRLAHRISFIDIESIKSISEEFNELGLNSQARLLENVYNFALAIKQSHNNSALTNRNQELAPVQYLLTLAPEEFSKVENSNNSLYTQFCSAFVKNSLNTSQKKALYTEFQNLIADKSEKKPHLTVMAAIILLRTKKSLHNPLPGSLNSCREAIFLSLELDPRKCHSYGDKSLKKGHNPSLLKYKDKAEEILQTALGKTR